MSGEPDVKKAAAEFCSIFKKDCEDSTVDRQTLRAKIGELSKRLTAATVFLPAYDQRQCSELLRAMQEQLSSSTAPRAKFSFASRKNKPEQSNDQSSYVQDATGIAGGQVAAVEGDLAVMPASPQEGRKHSSASTANTTNARTLADAVDRYIALPTPPQLDLSAIKGKDYYLLNLSGSVITLLPSPVAALHAKHLRNCLIISGPIGGSAMIEDCENCVFVIACRQFRMHNTKHSDIYLHIPSHPIIEDCSGIRFGSYPYGDLSLILCADTLSQLFDAAHLERDPKANKFAQVEDFKWLKRSPSPNWRLMDKEEEMETWRGCGVIPSELRQPDEGDEDGGEVEMILKKVLPSNRGFL